MTLPKRILAVIDPTADAQPALERAAALATKTGARLELFVCAYNPQLLEAELIDAGAFSKARRALLDEHLRRLQELAKPLAARGIETAVDVRWDSPLHEGIVRKAIESQADVVVKDTHYHAPLRRTIFANTDWELIRNCPAPLWLVKPGAMALRPCFVAAIDPLHPRDKTAELDHEIVRTAAGLATAFGGELHALYAFNLAAALAMTAGGMMSPMPEVIQVLKQDNTEAVHAFTDAHQMPRERVHISDGDTLSSLLALTDRLRADVVVMGAVSRSRLARLVLGNTADDLLDKIRCDVLVVKPPALRAALRG